MNRESEAVDREQWARTRLDYRFNDLSLLEQALTHSSASRTNNERLEFLGDAVLGISIARLLFESRPDDTEGELTRARAALVNGTTMAEIGRELAIDTQIILGKSELRAGGAQRESALADALEALIGAVFVDGGHAAADRLVEWLFAARLAALPRTPELKDAKSRLQEWLQGRGLGLPSYAVDSEFGSDHAKIFVVSCTVGELAAPTRGAGSSRRRAEQEAAATMLRELTDEHE